jgi:hypothetical protein
LLDQQVRHIDWHDYLDDPGEVERFQRLVAADSWRPGSWGNRGWVMAMGEETFVNIH